MKTTQIIVLGLAVAAAGGAYFVATNLVEEPTVSRVVKTEVVREATVKVLVAAERIRLGEQLRQERMKWQEWPKKGLVEGFITNEASPQGPEELAKFVARSGFFPGEPIRHEKLAKSDRGYLSAILPRGQRAVAVPVEAVTTAGGFVLPNDHVDVLITMRSGNTIVTETLLTNVRVLAVDQIIQESEDGSKSVVGDTATLQLSADHATLVTRMQRLGRLSLVLRSIEDSRENDVGGQTGGSGDAVTLIQFGKKKTVRPGRDGATGEADGTFDPNDPSGALDTGGSTSPGDIPARPDTSE